MKCLCCLCVGECVDMHTREKTSDRVDSDPCAVPPTISCILASQSGSKGALPSPDQRYGYWTGQDINISPAPFLSFPFFLTLSLLPFDMVVAFPRAVAHSQCTGRKCHEPEAHSHGNKAKWAEERYLSSRNYAAFMWWKSLKQPALTPGIRLSDRI